MLNCSHLAYPLDPRKTAPIEIIVNALTILNSRLPILIQQLIGYIKKQFKTPSGVQAQNYDSCPPSNTACTLDPTYLPLAQI